MQETIINLVVMLPYTLLGYENFSDFVFNDFDNLRVTSQVFCGISPNWDLSDVLP